MSWKTEVFRLADAMERGAGRLHKLSDLEPMFSVFLMFRGSPVDFPWLELPLLCAMKQGEY